jgi:hypothetical protein
VILTLTLKFTAESKGELIDSFAATVREFKTAMEQVVEKDGFAGIPGDHVRLRWLVDAGVWA